MTGYEQCVTDSAGRCTRFSHDHADPVVMVALAEAFALHEHNVGTCHLSEWSCSHCEREAAL